MLDIQTETMGSTPYDDVIKTTCNDLSELIIPLINEMFGEDYDVSRGNDSADDTESVISFLLSVILSVSVAI